MNQQFPPPPSLHADLDDAIEAGRRTLLAFQNPDGHFVFELEADATIPAEYVLLRHYLAEPVDKALEAGVAAYLRRIQGAHGGWPLFHDGAFNISASVKAYFALKMVGDSPDAAHMQRARAAILAHGGAAESNVFTRVMLALFGQVPWRAVPAMPVEIMLLPRWFPFHLDKISYWARAVLVPLLVLMAKRPQARNPLGVGIAELFTQPPWEVRRWPRGPQRKWPWAPLFEGIDAVLRRIEPFFPGFARKKAIARAEAFVAERLNGEDGLGAIFPAMANAVMMYDVLGAPRTRPDVRAARDSIDALLVRKSGEIYCQPCVSPVWDTALVAHALLEMGDPESVGRANIALDWLKPLQILDVKGDWAAQRPDLRPGGWAFQYANPHYPDVDDTAVVVMAMDRARAGGDAGFDEACARGSEWVEGLQSRNGGWGAFDADNNFDYLNYIPFADHGALLDPPTADVSARCLSMMAQLGASPDARGARKALDYLLRAQEKDGSWYGRWGMNYIYGTWSALCALNAAGLDEGHPAVARAARWLEDVQNIDGGWGEGGESYEADYSGYRPAPSTASQTAWAVLGLMAAGGAQGEAARRGIAHLLKTQGEDGFWREDRHTATGFPRVFYLRYHGYPKYFPLWALARYRNALAGNGAPTRWGM